MQHPIITVEQPWNRGHQDEAHAGPPLPGLLLVFTAERPQLIPLPLHARSLEIGRGSVGPVEIDDGAMSRRHAEVELVRGAWRVRDLKSRNGTAVDARPIATELESERALVLRCGDTLFLLCRDLGPYLGAAVEEREGVVVGPRLKRVWDEIDSIAASGPTLHVTGETGAGKELAARRFHESGPRAGGRFVAVNCAAIPSPLAERLLFGARRGAYSGADAHSEGYLQAADGGTLFLDEVAELEPGVQAKLLRALETREVFPLGAAHPTRVNLRVCSATHGGLLALAAAGRFRQDLFYRIGRPEVRLPPLRERAEEIPWLVQSVLAGRAAHVSLFEKALAYAWPGNVRELALEIREAVRRAAADKSPQVEGRHLVPLESGTSGAVQAAVPAPAAAAAPQPLPPPGSPPSPPVPPSLGEPPPREAIEAALEAQRGNVARTARALGMHRTQLRRWLERYQIVVRRDG